MANAIWTRPGPKRALVTGASGGIGEAFARILAEEGWSLFLVARRENELNRVAGVCHAEYGVEVHVLRADLSVPEEINRLMARLDQLEFAPDVLVNNAGFGLAGRAADLSREDQLRMIDLNVRALTDLTLRLLPHMRAQRAGGIINVASLAGFMPGPGMAVYFATKAYVLSFTDALAHELRDEGVTISALCPGPVKTGFFATAGMRRTLLSRLLPMASAQAVARDGWQGFKEGRTIIVPGVMNKLVAHGARFTPRALLRRMNALFTGLRSPRLPHAAPAARKERASVSSADAVDTADAANAPPGAGRASPPHNAGTPE